MLLDKYKRIIAALIFAFVTVSVFAADTSALVKKQLTAAEDAMDEGDIETAYKKVNGALQMMNEETSSTLRASVISEAKLVYSERLNSILEKYDGAALSDINIMLDKYPEVKNTKIEKLLAQIDEKQMSHTKAIIQSMTPRERRNPDLIKSSQKKRIADGSGTSIQEINQLLKQFQASKEMMHRMSKGKGMKGLPPGFKF